MASRPYSDDEESPVDFINETIPRQAQTPSPRTELLSPTSQPHGLQTETDRVRRSQRGPSERFRRQREQTYANASSRQLVSLLIEKEYEAGKLRKALNRAFDRFEAEAMRASEAERVTQETLNQFRAINEGKVAAERALGRSSEELRMWKFQFDHAQREIARAQEVVQLVERQRDDAERAAAKARTTARQLNEQRLVSDALEEGRKLGYQAGFRRAQQEMYNRDATPGEAYQDMEREIEGARIYDVGPQEAEDENPDSGLDAPLRDINASPQPPARSPQRLRMPQMPPQAEEAPPPSMPVPSPAMAMPSPLPAAAPLHTFETESVRRAPSAARSPSIQLSHFAVDIPSASVLNETMPSEYPRQQQRRPSSQAPPPENTSGYPRQQQRRPSSAQAPPPESIRAVSEYSYTRRPSPQASPPENVREAPAPAPRPTPRQPPPIALPPDNYIPSADAAGGIALPPPFQLSQPILQAAPANPNPGEPARTQSWYNRNPAEEQAQAQNQNQSWYQAPRRPRSNAGSATGRSNSGSVTGRSNSGSATGRSNAGSRHARHTSLDSRLRNPTKGANEHESGYGYGYGGPDLSAINEDARSARGSQRARSMQGSTESLVPPPPPEKDTRHLKQLIADELRYSNPDLAEAWRRDGAAETASTHSRPPRNVRVPQHPTVPPLLSPPKGSLPLGHMRARSMSGSTGKSGWSQPNMADLASRPSLRRVKEKRPIVPSDVGSPFSGTINVEPPSQSSSQIPLQMSASAGSQMDRYLSPNYQTQPLPVPTQPLPPPQNGQNGALPSGFVPQSVTVPTQITMPVTYKGRSISGPVAFPSEGGGGGGASDPDAQPRPLSG
ncbi:hypothetical protein DFH07DRAFT_395963, partial [Mycena maculata]